MKTPRGMTKRDLVEMLGHFDDDTPVHFQYNYGDVCRTQVAEPVTDAEVDMIGWSEYTRSPVLLGEYPDDHEDHVEVIVLRSTY